MACADRGPARSARGRYPPTARPGPREPAAGEDTRRRHLGHGTQARLRATARRLPAAQGDQRRHGVLDMEICELGAVRSLSPFLRGEGWGEGQTHDQCELINLYPLTRI